MGWHLRRNTRREARFHHRYSPGISALSLSRLQRFFVALQVSEYRAFFYTILIHKKSKSTHPQGGATFIKGFQGSGFRI